MIQADHPHFGEALAALDSGDADELQRLLDAHPDLVNARVTTDEAPYDGYFHAATLLHHVAGNPIRGDLPDGIVDVTRVLLDAGADTEAGCGGGPAQPGPRSGTVLGLVASGAQAHLRGLTEPLIDALLEGGAELDPEGGMWGTIYHTVEHRGQRDVARMLHERGVRVDFPMAAAIGRLDLMAGFIDADGGLTQDAAAIWSRTVRRGADLTDDEILADALLAASVNGWLEVVTELLDRGADINAIRPWGPFPVTPLHGAGWAGWPEVVTLLLSRGADATILDPTYDGTPRGWAEYTSREDAVAAFDQAGVKR